MRILFSPQRSDKRIDYSFNGEKITATLNGVTDTFDFSMFPNGQAVTEEIDTSLPVNPILSAKREGGVLSIVLLNYIGLDATEVERFPEWQEV